MSSYPSRQDPELDNLPATTAPVEAVPMPVLVQAPAEPVQLSDYASIIGSRWRLVALAALLGFVGGVLLTLVQKPEYRVKTSIEIQNINGEFMNMKQMTPVSDESYGNDALMDMQTQVELLKSQSLLENTKRSMRQMGVKREWIAEPTGMRKLVHADASTRLSDALLDNVADSVKVRPMGQTRVVQIQVDAPNPNLSADFANTLISEFVRENMRSRSQMTDAAEDATRSQLTDMRKKLEISEEDLQKYAASHGLVFTSERQSISDDRLKQVQSDLLRARAELVEKDAKRDLASNANAEVLPSSAGDDTSVRDLRAKLTDLNRQQAELLTVYKPDYSEVKKVRAQIDQTQTALQEAQKRIVSRINNDYLESAHKERKLTAAYDAAVLQATNESQTAVQYEILKRDVDANLTAYQDMLQKVKELSLAAAIKTSNIRVIDAAVPPLRPNSPSLPLNVSLGLFSGLTLAIGFVLISERSNKNLRHPGESLVRLGVPELAVIPSMQDTLRTFAPVSMRKSLEDGDFGLRVFQDNEFDAYAPTTDAFRTILTSLMLSGVAGKHPKAIVISSASPSEGKTTVASNMALACARAGKRVLLIDGDLRNPQLHNLFGVSNEIGLGNLLQGGCDEKEARMAILETPVARLGILPAGSFSAAPADLLFQPQLQILLRAYRKAFDIVLVDSPPLLRVPDSRLLGRCADGVILVARSNRTNRNSLLMACHRLTLDRSRVLGVVLNDWKGEPSPYPM
jgi:capsular exopolysaccharide synthesis family protein